MLEPRVEPIFSAMNRQNIVIYGCEAHICVRHTTLDAIARGFNVHVVVDATSSMTLPDRNVGIQALSDAGAHLTTFQGVVFELLRTTEHPDFKRFLPLLKDAPPATEPLDLIATPKL